MTRVYLAFAVGLAVLGGCAKPAPVPPSRAVRAYDGPPRADLATIEESYFISIWEMQTVAATGDGPYTFVPTIYYNSRTYAVAPGPCRLTVVHDESQTDIPFDETNYRVIDFEVLAGHRYTFRSQKRRDWHKFTTPRHVWTAQVFDETTGSIPPQRDVPPEERGDSVRLAGSSRSH